MANKWKYIICLTFLLLTIFFLPTKVYAHGVDIEYTTSTAIDIVATYDTGEPMSGAQVVVYAPDDPSTPWLTGTCDDEGRFTFNPDTSKPGTWAVQVRLAGHGDIVHIPVGQDAVASGGTGGYTILQVVLMSICVIWGIAGTALYFLRRRA
ncbi:MAG: carboxypeptidase-like regulatory domain-containing protein [Dehalococcoidia bacterium]